MPRFEPVRPSKLKLFDHAEDWWHNATLNTGAEAWSQIAEGYRDAADIVVENHKGSAVVLDWIAFPVVFLYRQYLELSMKGLLIDAGSLLDRPQDPGTSHSLEALWARLRPVR
jgi:hypothetical protein